MIPIFDGHNDTLLDLQLDRSGSGRNFFQRSEAGHIDLPRALEGGFAGGFFAVFPPADNELDTDPPETEGGYEVPLAPAIAADVALRKTVAMTARLFRLEAASQGAMRVVRTTGELRNCLQNNTLAAILHFEGAEAIDRDFDLLEVFYRAGLRSLGIVWSRPNAYGTGVPFSFPATPTWVPGSATLASSWCGPATIWAS